MTKTDLDSLMGSILEVELLMMKISTDLKGLRSVLDTIAELYPEWDSKDEKERLYLVTECLGEETATRIYNTTQEFLELMEG